MVRKIILLRYLEKSIASYAWKNRNNRIMPIFKDVSSKNWAKLQAVLHRFIFKFFTTYIYLYSSALSDSV